MEVIETVLKDCFIIKTKVFGDERGFFLESFNQKGLAEQGIHFDVKQINFAKSEKNVLRGLHYQVAPFGQTKLVGVISGAVVDVVVDIRKSSPTFWSVSQNRDQYTGHFFTDPKRICPWTHTFHD